MAEVPRLLGVYLFIRDLDTALDWPYPISVDTWFS